MSIKAAAGETDFTLLRCSAPAYVSDKSLLGVCHNVQKLI